MSGNVWGKYNTDYEFENEFAKALTNGWFKLVLGFQPITGDLIMEKAENWLYCTLCS